jgi:hypothetical protein
MVCEEDRTSWRISITLEDAIEDYSAELKSERIPLFAGFIVNEVTIDFTQTLVTFLERDIFQGAKCLAVIHFDEDIRRAFAEDRSIARTQPNSEFCWNLQTLANEVLEAHVVPIKRDPLIRTRRLMRSAIPIVLMLYAIIFIIFAAELRIVSFSETALIATLIAVVLGISDIVLLRRREK